MQPKPSGIERSERVSYVTGSRQNGESALCAGSQALTVQPNAGGSSISAIGHETARRLRFHLHADRHRAGAAARAIHRKKDALLLLLADLRVLEHRRGLLAKQLVQRLIA